MIVIWGPDIGVWRLGPGGRALQENTRVGFRRPGKEYRFWSADQKASVECLVSGGMGRDAACATVCKEYKVLLGAVPSWARRELLSWIPTKVEAALVPGDLTTLRTRTRKLRYGASTAMQVAKVLFWGGPESIRHLRESPRWVVLGGALILMGKGKFLRDIPRGMKAVLRAAFPCVNPGTLNALAQEPWESLSILDAHRMLQLNLWAWGSTGQHGILRTWEVRSLGTDGGRAVPIAFGVPALLTKMDQALKDHRSIRLHRVPRAEMWRNLGRMIANFSELIPDSYGGVRRAWRGGPPLRLGAPAGGNDAKNDEGVLDFLALLADALYVGLLLDGGAELARMRSWRRVDEYHRRAGQRLGAAVAQIQGDQRFPALPLAVVQGLRSAPGLEIQHLQNGAQLLVEGGRMRHCIASCSKMALEGQVALFHLRFSPAGQEEVEEASLMLGWKTTWAAVSTLGDEDIEPAAVQWSIFQLYGVKNQLVSKALVAAVVEAFDFDLPRGYWMRGLPPTPTVAAKIPLDGACSDRESRELHLVTHSGFLVREMEIVEVPQGPLAIDRILEGPRIFEGRRTHLRLPKTLSRLLTVAKHHPAERIYDVGVLAAPGIARDAGQTRHKWCPRPVRVL